MSQTIVGVFDTTAEAQAAAQKLMALGVNRDSIRISAQQATQGSSTHAGDDKGFWSSLKDAFGFGDDDDRYGYREAYRRGGTIVSATVSENMTDQAVAILQEHKAVNLDERASQWRDSGWTGYDRYERSDAAANTARPQAASAAAGDKLEVVEEELTVGKRAVNRGGIRIHSHVTERPVEEQVNLRQETVSVERRPVNRPVTAADQAFQDRTIEVTETDEEAVVAKQARVVEEVVVNKEVEQQTETVRDTVKRTDVEVEQIEGGGASRPVYEFADELSRDERYRGREWSQVESDARRSFEQRHPSSKWDEHKDTIRSRYDRARSGT